MLKQPVISLLKRQRYTEPLLFLLFGEVDFKRAKNLWCSLRLGKAARGRWSWKERGMQGERERESALGDGRYRGVERGSPLICGRRERRRKETESSKEDCKQGMHSIPNSSTNARRNRQTRGGRRRKKSQVD